MKIVTFAAIKGGVGKTTLTYNFAEYLASKDKKILLIDFDHQSNLSQVYKIFDSDKFEYNPEKTVGNIFTPNHNGEVEVYHVKNNIDILAGDLQLDDKEIAIENRTDKNMMLFQWLSNVQDKLNLDQYDYILIDTHPDFSLATKNAIVVSDAVFSPITPDEFGYKAKWNLEPRFELLKNEARDFVTGKSYVTANLFFIANKVQARTNSSRDFLKNLENDHEDSHPTIAIIPQKELFTRSTIDKVSLAEMEQQPSIRNKNKEFFNDLDKQFDDLVKSI